MRQRGEKHSWLARSDAGYVIFELQAIKDLLVQDDKFRTSFDGIVDIMGARGTPWGRFAEEQMIALPDRDHRILRDTFAAKFTPRHAGRVRPLMREVMLALLQEWAPRRSIDFAEFASYFPVSVMTRMIGAPVEAIPGLRSAMEALGLAFSMDKTMLPALNEGMERLETFATQLISDRRANPRSGEDTDLLDLLITAGDEGGVSDRVLFDLLIFLFVAGYDTSKNVLTYMMHLMLRNPDIYRRCADDLDYCERAVEEALRMFNPSSVFRTSTQDIVYRDVLIPRDTMLFFTLNVSGRDPTAFADADRFDPDRTMDPSRRHVAFGRGKHICLGQYIARAQLQEGIHLIAQHMRDPKQAGEPGWRPFPGVWGLTGLPISFTPAEPA